MIYSMTGYAAKTIQIGDSLTQIEIKSVNHRFLDINFKAADEFKPIENNIRALISAKISRGKVDIKIFAKEDRDNRLRLNLDYEFLQQYLALVHEVDQLTHCSSKLNACQLLATPGVLKQHKLDSEEAHQLLVSTFSQLVDDFCQTQASEGNKLCELLRLRLNELSSIIHEVRPILNYISQSYQTKLKQRLADFMHESEINDARLQQEVAFFCQKMDVSEELDRLNAHISEFQQLLDKGGHIGKRLDFMCQEMHREANTFGAKSVAMETTRKAVDLKVLIEQIREQVQNIV